MIWKLTPVEQVEILDAVLNAVNISFHDPSESEPQLIANLVKQLPDQLNGIALGGSRSICAGGVFIHQKPFAACTSFPEPTPKSVELGDLLLIRTAKSRGVVLERRALLLQAKKAAKLPTKPDNKNQYHLYSNWPAFEYRRAGPELNGKTRHIKGPGLYSGAKYFLIGPDPTSLGCIGHWPLSSSSPLSCQLATAEPAAPELNAYKCFFREVVDFIAGNSGRHYLSPPPKWTRGWDRVIDDLLSNAVSAKKSVYTKRAGVPQDARGNSLNFLSGNIDESRGVGLLYTPREGIDQGNQGPPDIPNEETSDDDNNGGVSVIEFVVTDDEFQESS